MNTVKKHTPHLDNKQSNSLICNRAKGFKLSLKSSDKYVRSQSAQSEVLRPVASFNSRSVSYFGSRRPAFCIIANRKLQKFKDTKIRKKQETQKQNTKLFTEKFITDGREKLQCNYLNTSNRHVILRYQLLEKRYIVITAIKTL